MRQLVVTGPEATCASPLSVSTVVSLYANSHMEFVLLKIGNACSSRDNNLPMHKGTQTEMLPVTLSQHENSREAALWRSSPGIGGDFFWQSGRAP